MFSLVKSDQNKKTKKSEVNIQFPLDLCMVSLRFVGIGFSDFSFLGRSAPKAHFGGRKGKATLTSAMDASPPLVQRPRTRAKARIETYQRREQMKRIREEQDRQRNLPASKRLATAASPVRVGASLMSPKAVKPLAIETTTSATEVRMQEVHSPPMQQQVPKQEPVVTVPTPEKDAPVTLTTEAKQVAPARGIAQSGSSSARKRMISFSPERSERPPENEVLALQRLQKNLKADEKLQLRLDGTPLKAGRSVLSATTTPLKTAARRMLLESPKNQQTTPFQSPVATLRPSAHNTPLLLSQTRSPPTMIIGSGSPDVTVRSSCKQLVFTMDELSQRDDEDNNDQENEPPLSQLSQSYESVALDASQSTTALPECAHEQTDMSSSSFVFTSTSVIEDVGLFNCETDVEYTGGVYGEGTDGKVSAAVIGGQKVALKRAKPHEGYPEEEAKRRSAIELHYLRKVRHMEGFVQCLGLCDGVEHTCIALEVMDCKLSDYLRRYGICSASVSGSSKKRRCFTLSYNDTKALLRQICLPMMALHEKVNVAHGDLACRNILLRTPPKGYEQKWEPVVKLTDFGRIKIPSSEPKILDESFSFYKNCDIGSFAREILFRLLVGEIVPAQCLETRHLHKYLQDVVVKDLPQAMKTKLGPFASLFQRCASWGVRPTFREIYEHLDDLQYFETSENGLFPLKPSGGIVPAATVNTTTPNTHDAGFMSPVANDEARTRYAGSSSKQFDTPVAATTTLLRPASGRRMISQSCTNATAMSGLSSTAPGTAPSSNKTVNWLKARSVLSNPPPHPTQQLLSRSNTQASATASQAYTPNGRPALLKKKTPPSAGASRRSLQILNQIQHRSTSKKAM